MVKTTKATCGPILIAILLISIGLLVLIRAAVQRPSEYPASENGIEQLESLANVRAESLKLPTNISFHARLARMQFDVNNDLVRRKTPRDVLHELLRAGGRVASYNYTESGYGKDRFECRVSLDNDSTTGPSKKASMHAASKKMIDFLAGERVPEDFYLIPGNMRRSSHSSSSTSSTTTVDEKFRKSLEVGNFIGVLELLAAKRLSPKPEYEEQGVAGPSHNRTFTIICKFEGISAYGNGTAKKAARQKAAENMWLHFAD